LKKLKNISLTLFFTAIIVLGFALPLNPPNGSWYQQFFPPLNGATIKDILFVDSLNGYAITTTSNDSNNYFLKTTNGGDSWEVKFTDSKTFTKLQFININTGFIGRGFVNSPSTLYKSTNAGINWFTINLPVNDGINDLFALNEDTIWVADPVPFDGGLYRTTNKGTNWDRISWNTTNNPLRIYMYNARIGFKYYSDTGPLLKTTDGGFNWFNVNGGAFYEIKFLDSLTGWKAKGDMKNTTDGGLNWTTQTLPTGGIIFTSVMQSISIINYDTIWGSGGTVFYGAGRVRGLLYKSTNGGINWNFNITDTSFGIAGYYKVQFINQKIGWGFGIINNSTLRSNIHTTNGGDTNFLTGLTQISNEVPSKFKLYQNYPNPFNPKTIIKYQLTKNKTFAQLIIYDLMGKEVIKLVDQVQNSGTYEVDFPGSGYSSGVYFYQLTVTNGKEVYRETKKMLLIK